MSPASVFRLTTIHDSATATARYNRKSRLDLVPAQKAATMPPDERFSPAVDPDP